MGHRNRICREKKNGKELEFLMSMVINLTIVLDTGSKFYTSYEL